MIAEAIKTIQEADATAEVRKTIAEAIATPAAIAALPDSFSKHDLEQYLPHRRRAIGTMSTDSIDDFATYTKEHKDLGATVFVDADNLKAVGILNLGTTEKAGHADNKSALQMIPTAAYQALKAIVASPKKQAEVAEFIEDWQDIIKCTDQDGDTLSNAHAIEAARTITIEALRKMESKVADFEHEGTVMDSIKATARQKLPARIAFTAVPFKGLAERTFELRVGIQTGGQAPMLALRIIKIEDHKQQMADELANMLRGKFAESNVPVLVGTYARG